MWTTPANNPHEPVLPVTTSIQVKADIPPKPPVDTTKGVEDYIWDQESNQWIPTTKKITAKEAAQIMASELLRTASAKPFVEKLFPIQHTPLEVGDRVYLPGIDRFGHVIRAQEEIISVEVEGKIMKMWLGETEKR